MGALTGTAIAAILATVAEKVAAPILKNILQKKIGGAGDGLVDLAVDKVAEKLGVPPADIPAQKPEAIERAVIAAEAETPEMIALWSQGLEGQFALLQAENREGFWQAAWRWGWMYLLAIFWTCYVLVFPVLAAAGIEIERIDAAILLTLTTWFISLYMGGHTVKALGESAINAVRSWKGQAR